MSKTLLQTSPTDVIALASDLRYPFAASTALADGSTITLADRTNTPASCAVSGAAITVCIAASQSGYMRDLLFVLDCTSLDPDTDDPPTLAWADAGGGSVEAFDAAESDSVDLTAEAGETIVYLVTEMVSGRLVVARHILAEAAS